MAACPERGLKAPEIRQYIERGRLTANFVSSRPQPTYDEESCNLIDELHQSQRRVDRLDYLIRQTEKEMKTTTERR